MLQVVNEYVKNLPKNALQRLWVESRALFDQGYVPNGAKLRFLSEELLGSDETPQLKIVARAVFRNAADRYFSEGVAAK